MLTRLNSRRGFSLIELAVVLIISAIIAAIAIPTFVAVIGASEDSADESSATAIGRNALALTAATSGSGYTGGTNTTDVTTSATEAGATVAGTGPWDVTLDNGNCVELTVTGQSVSADAAGC